MNLILAGLKASGKSTIGKLLAEKFHWRFVDLHSLIEGLYFNKKGIRLGWEDIYKREGKENFTELESKAVEEVLKSDKQVVSLGIDTLFLGEDILNSLKKNTIIHISTKPDILYHRIQKSCIQAFFDPKNPEENFRKLYNEKVPLYENMADFSFDNSEKKIEEVVKEISKTLKGRNILENWYAVRTKSRHEQKVKDRLVNKSFKIFLPMIEAWSKRKDRKKKILKPLFPGYLFIDFELNKGRWLDILKTPGVANLLGYSNEPYPVPEEQISSIRTVIDSGVTISHHPYLKKGDKVKVVSGPMEGAIGILMDIHEKKQRLVISIDMLNSAVSVELEGADVEKY